MSEKAESDEKKFSYTPFPNFFPHLFFVHEEKSF